MIFMRRLWNPRETPSESTNNMKWSWVLRNPKKRNSKSKQLRSITNFRDTTKKNWDFLKRILSEKNKWSNNSMVLSLELSKSQTACFSKRESWSRRPKRANLLSLLCLILTNQNPLLKLFPRKATTTLLRSPHNKHLQSSQSSNLSLD